MELRAAEKKASLMELQPQVEVEEDNKSIFEMDLPNETDSQEQIVILQEQQPEE